MPKISFNAYYERAFALLPCIVLTYGVFGKALHLDWLFWGIRISLVRKNHLEKAEEAVLSALDSGPLTGAQIVNLTRLSLGQIYYCAYRLEKAGLLVRDVGTIAGVNRILYRKNEHNPINHDGSNN